VLIDAAVGSDELQHLAAILETPCRLGDFTLDGLIMRTSTALVFIGRGGAFAATEGVIKLTGKEFAPLLERELGLLRVCCAAAVINVVRPVQLELEWLLIDGSRPCEVAALLLPFLAGGDLLQVIGAHATRTGHLTPGLALQVGEIVASTLRELLRLPRPIIHSDVKPQNLLLPYPDAPLSELTLIDFDASDQLDLQLDELASAPREIAQRLVEDVHGFGALLYNVATGNEPPLDVRPDPRTRNAAFNLLVERCLTSEVDGSGYLCLADNGLWHDLETAHDVERAGNSRWRPGWRILRHGFDRRHLAVAGAVLFLGLATALAARALGG
jgi:serine/threonine protein kinase